MEPSDALLIYGHRGARGLVPENTLVAYKKALTMGVDFVDMDIGMTKDGVLVVTHDDALNPILTKNKYGYWIKKQELIKSLTLKQLKEYNVCGSKPGSFYKKLFRHQAHYKFCSIPTLAEVIDTVKQLEKKKVGFQIEIKTDPRYPQKTFSPEIFARALVELLHIKGISDITEVQAFDFRCLQALKKLDPHIKTAYLTEADSEATMLNSNQKIAALWTGGPLLKNYHYSIPQLIKALGGNLWDPQDIELNASLVKEAHRLGLKVIVWSWVEHSKREYDEAMIRKLIRWKVDGIITDRPDLLRRLLAMPRGGKDVFPAQPPR